MLALTLLWFWKLKKKSVRQKFSLRRKEKNEVLASQIA